jgi:tetratricopeptide (TPR) repeat protein
MPAMPGAKPAPQKKQKLAAAIVLLFALSPLGAATTYTDRPSASPIPAILLLEPRDTTALDAQIRTSQFRLKHSALPGAELERLGWLFVAKARVSSDPGYITLAGIAADTLEQSFALPAEARLLRGHVLHAQHRFADAEKIARALTTEKSSAAAYALLGDALYDQGQISAAAEAYQHMVDLKPGLDSYSRAANIRWIRGDLAGAIELQTLAVRSGGPGDSGALAWSLVRLGQLVWQQGNATETLSLVRRALELVPEFEPALLLEGRVLLASGRANDALVPLARAAQIFPLPEPRWVYAEALRAAGRDREATSLEAQLVREGVAEDPRTVAQFLATRDQDSATAVRLATGELENRSDVQTHSVAALALADDGRIEEAMTHARAALAERSDDARLLLHAGRVAALAHQPDARDLLTRARERAQILLPSERRLLETSFSLLAVEPNSATNLHQTTHPKTS